MQEKANAINREDVTVGFWRGVSRAAEGGLDVSGVLVDRDDLIDTIARIMAKLKEEVERAEPESLPIWNPRAVKHAAENITTFEIAWRAERKPNSLAMTEDDMKGYLKAFLTRGNCWSHKR